MNEHRIEGSVVSLFLCGDVMIGRGIDQVMPRSVDPVLHEPHIASAEGYVELAVRANGPFPRPVTREYVWGQALEQIDSLEPDARIINLETAVTTSPAAWPDKEVLYRTHSANVAVLQAANIDCCVLANNHVLDWGHAGLAETLDSLHDVGLRTAGAGRNLAEAWAPTVVDTGEGRRVIVIGVASTTSGTPLVWKAGPGRPGVAVVEGWSDEIVQGVAANVGGIRRSGDIVVASIHWGSNWGYGIPDRQRRLAHQLIDIAGVDLVHGHSSHHPRPIELYRGRLILYGCGDFITDYEGIGGHDAFRGDLALAYFPILEPATGHTVSLAIAPFKARRFQLVAPSASDVAWLGDTLTRISRSLGVRVEPDGHGLLWAM